MEVVKYKVTKATRQCYADVSHAPTEQTSMWDCGATWGPL